MSESIEVLGTCPITGEELTRTMLPDGSTLENFFSRRFNGVEGEVRFHDSVCDPRRCADCGKYFDISDEGTQCVDTGNSYCGDCECDNACTCEYCGEVVYSENVTCVSNGNVVCESCLEDHYTRCDFCGEYCLNDEVRTAENGDAICDDCYENNYFTCECCDEVLHNDEYCENGMCYGCAERNGGVEVHSYHYGRNHSLYSPLRIGSEKEKDLLFGVELECERGRLDGDEIEKWTEDDAIHFEHDGSLDDSTGVEMITRPCTLEYHKWKFDWDGLCRKMRGMGFRSHDTNRCGLHVHISRSALKPTTIVKMDVLLNRYNHMFWQYIARRGSSRYAKAQADKVADATSGYHSSFEIPDKLREKMVKSGKIVRFRDRERYSVFNLLNDNTVEIRMARGTLNSETVLGTIEMYHALVKFCDTISWYDLYATNVCSERFVKFVFANVMYKTAQKMMMRLLSGHIDIPWISESSDGEE